VEYAIFDGEKIMKKPKAKTVPMEWEDAVFETAGQAEQFIRDNINEGWMIKNGIILAIVGRKGFTTTVTSSRSVNFDEGHSV